MKNKNVLFLTQAAMIAALYTVLTIFINAFGLASGAIQVRISEALTVGRFLKTGTRKTHCVLWWLPYCPFSHW